MVHFLKFEPLKKLSVSFAANWLHHRNFTAREEARTCIFEYNEGLHNLDRLHSTWGCKSPKEYEMLWLAASCSVFD